MHQCKHGCGYTNGHRGAMNLHEQIHCQHLRSTPTQPRPVKRVAAGGGGAVAAVKDKPAVKATRYCDCDGAGSWEFLSSGDPSHVRALAAGYKKVCTECGEVV